jgi:hypothetical protein
MTAGNGTQGNLEQRLSSVLADGRTSSSELRDLIKQTEAAADTAEREAARLHAAARELGCEDAAALEQKALAADLLVERMDAALPKLDQKLKEESAADYSRKWKLRHDRAVVARDTVAKRFAAYREMAAQMAMIFEEAKYTDEKIIGPVNDSRPAGEAPLQTCELHARKLDAFSRSIPSILDRVQLVNWDDSEKNIWPPRPVPMAVLMAESMVPAPNIAHTDRWFEAVGERRAEQAAEQQKTAAYYDEQARLKEERDAREALAAAERQRQGYP